MKLEINIEKRYFFILLGAVLLLIAGVFVIAYNPLGTGGNPAVMGHSVDEVDWNQNIRSGVKIQMGTGDPLSAQRAALLELSEYPGDDTGRPNLLSTGNSMDFGVWRDQNMEFGDFDGGNWRERMRLVSDGLHITDGLRIGNSGKITFISGTNPSCPGASNLALLMKWNAKTCNGRSPGSAVGTSCSTRSGWAAGIDQNPPTCGYIDEGFPKTCTADRWSRLLCMD